MLLAVVQLANHNAQNIFVGMLSVLGATAVHHIETETQILSSFLLHTNFMDPRHSLDLYVESQHQVLDLTDFFHRFLKQQSHQFPPLSPSLRREPRSSP
jgi:hypothetical protein